MTADDLEVYLRELGMDVERVSDTAGNEYSVARRFEIQTGGLRGRSCDVAIQRVATSPYVVPSAIHTKPALVRMDSGEPLGTQGSPLGEGWQYWSRRFDHPPSPQRIWAHILTILGDERWEPV